MKFTKYKNYTKKLRINSNQTQEQTVKKANLYLFSIDIHYQKELNKKIISTNLHKAFESHKAVIPSTAKIKVKHTKRFGIRQTEWQISKTKYVISIDENKLKVYYRRLTRNTLHRIENTTEPKILTISQRTWDTLAEIYQKPHHEIIRVYRSSKTTY